jgi:hypothetical protein
MIKKVTSEEEITRLDRYIDWAYKIGGVLLIPLVVAIFWWGVSLEKRLSDIKIQLAVQAVRNQNYVDTLNEVKRLARKLEGIVNTNNTSVNVFKSEFKRVDGNITNLQKSLDRVDELGRKINAALK